ncbi:penicillin-binding transpeptidase domain-containing protein [Desulfobotulus sp. H1]|uniref:Penicillin-binding transpeptidase domain-containing protein n=1 Tax=Desulfobotulus pelophilus TaxID=2823377 RepID=A0ABT3N890_9BACT|nr:penicillin-binding transpeptidase domain-containing protein [Desulfobotulus pelophilus]MCW7753672.1 penicillin-binding transpeptidase domain-containing protein [Desulfobotulus pelophilus]
MSSYKPEPSWRREQIRRIREDRPLHLKTPALPGIRILGYFLSLLLVTGLLFYLVSFFTKDRAPSVQDAREEETVRLPEQLTDHLIRQALEDMPHSGLLASDFPLHIMGQPFTVETTLDLGLQARLQRFVLQAETAGRGMPELLALVVMEPETGKIRGLAGTRGGAQGGDPSVPFTVHPAASIFKIVAAVAAMELQGLTPDSPLFFNGDMYTLYKRQMSQQEHRHTNRISFKDAFAQSVNPVFGKLGYHDLKKSGLREYATRFGFSGPAPKGTLPVPQNQIHLSDTPYSWAEIASGFNRRTLISPLHGASIAAAVVSDGRMPPPHIIEKVMDADNRIRYQGYGESVQQAMKKETADAMRVLMNRTVSSGTSSRIFRGQQRDRILKNLEIGGKTGSISNHSRDIRYDWFVGYAVHPDGRKIVVSVMVGHGAYIGRRAGEYAKSIFSFWFDPSRLPAES